MRLKSHVTIREYAEVIGEVHKDQTEKKRRNALDRLRWRMERAGLLERAPGKVREYRVSVARVRELERDVYDLMRREARFWEDGCPHPVKATELVAPGLKWCMACGSLRHGQGEWRLPASQQFEEF